MATAETVQQPHGTDRPVRRRPFSTWVKKLASFKSTSADTTACPPHSTPNKRNTYQIRSHSKRLATSKKNNPYPESGYINGHTNGHGSFSTGPSGMSRSTPSLNQSRNSVRSSQDGHPPPTIGNKSMAATVSTAAPSHTPSSGQGTNATNGCGISSGQGAGSTFSSPAPSVRSLATTLTTIQSVSAATAPPAQQTTNANNQTMQFSHQFPISPPPSALPAHLVPSGSGGHPPTYSTATANNLLTDNASILTLASSSKRRRRRSMDTDASVRALAPSSLFGGSRESLPLSVLSANIDSSSNVPPTPHQPRPSLGGLNERASIYSATGVAPALPSERNSYYAGKQSILADGGSVKSGLVGHGRNDSTSGSIGGLAASGSPLASPKDAVGPSSAGRLSRNNSGWGEADDVEKVEAPKDEGSKAEDSKAGVS